MVLFNFVRASIVDIRWVEDKHPLEKIITKRDSKWERERERERETQPHPHLAAAWFSPIQYSDLACGHRVSHPPSPRQWPVVSNPGCWHCCSAERGSTSRLGAQTSRRRCHWLSNARPNTQKKMWVTVNHDLISILACKLFTLLQCTWMW